MCGIVGIYSNRPVGLSYKQLDFFKQALIADSVRGNHGTGVLRVSGPAEKEELLPSYLKLAGDPFSFFALKEAPDLFKDTVASPLRALVGHNRFATAGARTSENAHPFKNEHIWMVHNGTLEKHLCDIPKIHEKAVDSDALCHSIAELGLDETIKRTVGAYASVYFDEKLGTLNFFRNDDRPLWFALSKHEDFIAWASEEGMLKWLLERNDMGTHVASFKEDKKGFIMFPLEKNKLFSLDFKTLKFAMRDLPKQKERYKAVYSSPACGTDDDYYEGYYHRVRGDGINKEKRAHKSSYYGNSGCGYTPPPPANTNYNYNLNFPYMNSPEVCSRFNYNINGDGQTIAERMDELKQYFRGEKYTYAYLRAVWGDTQKNWFIGEFWNDFCGSDACLRVVLTAGDVKILRYSPIVRLRTHDIVHVPSRGFHIKASAPAIVRGVNNIDDIVGLWREGQEVELASLMSPSIVMMAGEDLGFLNSYELFWIGEEIDEANELAAGDGVEDDELDPVGDSPAARADAVAREAVEEYLRETFGKNGIQ